MPTTASFEDDLSFLRGLVQSNGNHQALFGELYMAAGLTYGLQTLGHWAQALGVLSLSPYQGLALATGPTALFLAYLGWALWRSRRSPIGGVTNRAVNAAFGAAGFANLIMAAVVGMLAIREGSLTIWLLYPCLVFIIQGAAWGVAYALRPRLARPRGAWLVGRRGRDGLLHRLADLCPDRQLEHVRPDVRAGRSHAAPFPQGTLNMGGFDIAKIDDVIHGRLRLGIMAYLANAEVADFTELKEVLDATQGNLSVHLRKLEEAGYVSIEKSFLGRKPLTRIRMTTTGAKAFAAYLDAIAKLVA